MTAASSEKGEDSKEGESGVLRPSEALEANLERSSEISCLREARASEDEGPPSRFME